MAKNDVRVDTREFDKRLKIYTERGFAAATKQLHNNGLDLEKESVLLAPVDKHWLEGSASTSKPRTSGNDVIVTVGFNESYATSTHERMTPAVSAFPMKPGPGTRSKPATRFGKPGGKYLERPLLGKMDEWTREIANAVKRVK